MPRERSPLGVGSSLDLGGELAVVVAGAVVVADEETSVLAETRHAGADGHGAAELGGGLPDNLSKVTGAGLANC